MDEDKRWYEKQTLKVRRLTIWLAFIAALGAAGAVLKGFGVDLLDITIGCSSVSNQTQMNSRRLDTLFTERYWKSLRAHRQDSLNVDFDARLDKLEKRRR